MRFSFFKRLAPPTGAPPAASGRAVEDLLRPEAALRADLVRAHTLIGFLGFGFLLLVPSLAWVSTHHTVQPYVLQSGRDGSIAPAQDTLAPYTPKTPEKHYFVAQWVKHFLTLDSALTEAWLKETYQQTRGKASVEFTDRIKLEAPLQSLKTDPSLTRTITISSISMLDADLALVRVVSERRSLSQPSARIDHWLITLHFSTQTPSDEAAILKNPIGLVITDFQIGEDLQ